MTSRGFDGWDHRILALAAITSAACARDELHCELQGAELCWCGIPEVDEPIEKCTTDLVDDGERADADTHCCANDAWPNDPGAVCECRRAFCFTHDGRCMCTGDEWSSNALDTDPRVERCVAAPGLTCCLTANHSCDCGNTAAHCREWGGQPGDTCSDWDVHGCTTQEREVEECAP